MKRPRGTGSIFEMKGSNILWIKYHRNGKPVRESSHTTKVRDAERLLGRRLAEVATNTLIEPRDRRVLVDDLYTSLLSDYRNNEMASLEGAVQRWNKRLRAYFSGLRAASVTTEALNRYVDRCRSQELANATINRDLAALKRAYNLALKAGRIQRVPSFPHLREAAPRSGFVEQATYERLKNNAGTLWLRALLATAYAFGFRKSELLNLRVKQVDLVHRSIRLNAGETKSGEGRVVKLTQDVFVLLQACVAGKDAADFVFTRENGKPIKGFRAVWKKLTTAAGAPGLLLHDLRRSAVRNMVRNGVTEKVAMTISGHKTRAVFDRYDIVDERDLDEAARKIEAAQKTAPAPVWAEFGQSGEQTKDSAATIPLPAGAAN